MSDLLEEIKTKWKTIHMGHIESLNEDDVDWLIAEVERLRSIQVKPYNIGFVTTKGAEEQIESLQSQLEAVEQEVKDAD